MPREFPSAQVVAFEQARLIREALAAAPGSPIQTRLLSAALHLGASITPLSQPAPTPGQIRHLHDLAARFSRWFDIHFADGSFAGAIEALTAGLEPEAVR